MVEIKAARLHDDTSTTVVKTMLRGHIVHAALRGGKLMLIMGDSTTEWHLLLDEHETKVLIRGLFAPEQATIAGQPPAIEAPKKRRQKKLSYKGVT